MKMVKSLLLGTAAGLVGVMGAQAADLPVKAKPVEYVKICSLYGQGFYYIPGTDTCLKIGGFIRSEWVFHGAGSFAQFVSVPGGLNNRSINELTNRSRAVLSFDVRSQTEYGVLRGYVRAGWQWTTGDSITAGSGATAYIDRAFLQFAGFTFGRAQSYFDHFITPLYTYQTNVIGSDTGGTGFNLWAYTAQFGNGVTGTISFEDNQGRSHSLINADVAGALSPANIAGATANIQAAATGVGLFESGQQFPDVVGNLRVDQAWGSAQVMAALHPVNALYYGSPAREINGYPDDEWGWAVGAGLTVNLPWAKGDSFSVQVNWADGASHYTMSSMGSAFRYDGNTVAIGFAPDGVYSVALGNIELVETWSLMAGIQHYWAPNWRSSLYGGYAQADFSNAAAVAMCAAGFGGAPAGAAGISNCNPNFSYWQIGTRTIWNPVANLDVGVEVMYQNIDTGFAGTVALPAFSTKPAGLYTTTDQDIFSGIIRVQRNFWP
jgi:hypothetical protein